jgi:N-acetylglucosamine-6-sulfatase
VKRRHLLLIAISFTALLAALPSHASALRKPNIVLITTDDQALADFNARSMPKTARQLAGKGTTFSNAIVTTPQCCPSRASIITGQYAHNNGVMSNRLSYPNLIEKDNTLPVWLDRAGYKTAHVGKYLNGYDAAAATETEVAPGWDLWFTTKGTTRYYDYDVSANGRLRRFGSRERDNVTAVINRKARTLIRRMTPKKAPLYLQVDHRAPHTETGVESKGRCGGRAVPEKRDNKLFGDEPLPLPPSLNELDVSDKPSFISTRPPLDELKLRKATKRHRCALASLRSVDRGVRAIIKELKRRDELGKTVIAFISDNGFYGGEHRIGTGKIYPYEEGIRVPLAMRVPEKYRGGGERIPEVSAPVANIDLAPTLLELGRARPCKGGGACRTMDGRSLLGLVSGQHGGFPEQRALVTEFDQGFGESQKDGLCGYAGVRVPGAIYIEHIVARDEVDGCLPAPERELYDLASDPFQLHSLESDSSADGLEASLKERLNRLRDCAGIAGRDERVDGRPFCE